MMMDVSAQNAEIDHLADDNPGVPHEVIRRFYVIVHEEGDMEYPDNFRYAPFDDKLAVLALEAADGCCGKFQYDVKDDTGRRWLCACNYGHWR